MKNASRIILSTLLTAAATITAEGAAELNQPAPDFTLPGISGEQRSLADYAGKVVVLEWINHGCPYVKKHYDSGNMRKLQKKYTGKDVIWLAVCSSAPGSQGYYTLAEWPEVSAAHKSAATDLLVDESGETGRAYGARTTPHMYVIDGNGVLVYRGAIDDNSSTDPATVKGARNYVAEVLDALLAGEEVTVSDTRPYGCSVKYAK